MENNYEITIFLNAQNMEYRTITSELIILFIFLTVNKIVLLYQEAIKLMDITKASVSNSDYLFVTDFRIPRNAKLFQILFREFGQGMYCTSSLKLRQSLHSTKTHLSDRSDFGN